VTTIEILHNWITAGDRPDFSSVPMTNPVSEAYVHLCELIEQEYQAEQRSLKRMSGLKGSLQNPQREVTDEDGTIRRL